MCEQKAFNILFPGPRGWTTPGVLRNLKSLGFPMELPMHGLMRTVPSAEYIAGRIIGREVSIDGGGVGTPAGGIPVSAATAKSEAGCPISSSTEAVFWNAQKRVEIA